MTAASYALAYLMLPLFGAALAAPAAAFIESRAARAGFAFLSGALLLTVESLLFSAAHIGWSAARLSVPLLALAAVAIVLARRRTPAAPLRFDPTTAPAVVLIVAAAAHFAATIVTTQSVSPDYLLFWGSKAVRFAASRAADPELLRWRYFGHGIPEYPPLVPVVQAWGLLCTRSMPWITGAAMSAVWLLAAAPFVWWALRRAGAGHELTGANRYAAGATAFWAVAMANSLAVSGSGGNAEAMLLAYLTVAGAAIVVEPQEPRCRWIAMAALAGAALTKAEALVSVLAILAGVAVRDAVNADRRGFGRLAAYAIAPAAALGMWFGYEWRFGLPVGYHRYNQVRVFFWKNLPEIARGLVPNLAAGSWWIPWLAGIAGLVFVAAKHPRDLRGVIPLLLPVPLLFAFFVFVYLQEPNAVAMKMTWTLPRISQPVLSLLLLAAMFGGAAGRRHRPADGASAPSTPG